MNRIRILLLALAVSIFAQKGLAEDHRKEITASTPLKASYKIIVSFEGKPYTSEGSGTAISPKHILTCSHVLSDPMNRGKVDEIIATKPGGFQWKLKLIEQTNWKDKDQDDLALLEYDGEGPTEFLDFVPLETGDALGTFEDKVLGIIGYTNRHESPEVLPAKLTKNDYIRETYTTDSQIEEGQSGGGVFTPSGKLAGVAYGKHKEVTHAVGLTGILNWTRVKQYVPSPYGGFTANVYRDFSLFGRQRQIPNMYVLPYPPLQPVPQNPNTQQQQQQQQSTLPPTTYSPPNVQQGQQVPAPTYVQPMQSMGCNSCNSGGGGMMMGSGMMMAPQMTYRQPARRQQLYYDPNVSPYAVRQTRPPATQQPQQKVAEQSNGATNQVATKSAINESSGKAMASSPCSCDRESLEEALNELACKCDSKELSGIKSKLDELTSKINSGEQTCTNCENTAAIQQGLDGLRNALSKIEQGSSGVSKSLDNLADRIDGIESQLDAQQVSSGKYTPQKPTETSEKPLPGFSKTETPELLYLTAVNCKDCNYTDAIVERLIKNGVKIRVVRLHSGQYTGVKDVPRLTVFQEGLKPDNYLGSSNIAGFLASVGR